MTKFPNEVFEDEPSNGMKNVGDGAFIFDRASSSESPSVCLFERL